MAITSLFNSPNPSTSPQKKPDKLATDQGAGGKGSSAKANVDYNSFLKLLVAQMRNQDPTKPMEATEYVAQLATFSNVEQAVQINAKLDTLIGKSSLAQADGLIGRTLTSADGTISGTIKSVLINKSGLVAELVNGAKVPVTDGVKLS